MEVEFSNYKTRVHMSEWAYVYVMLPTTGYEKNVTAIRMEDEYKIYVAEVALNIIAPINISSDLKFYLNGSGFKTTEDWYNTYKELYDKKHMYLYNVEVLEQYEFTR